MFVNTLNLGPYSRGPIKSIGLIQPRVQLAKINQFIIDEEPDEELLFFIVFFAVVSVSGAATVSSDPRLGIN
jgi:hypothetical protein